MTGARVNHVESARTEGARVGRDSVDIYGVLNGTQRYAPVDVPINLVGNALGIPGLARSHAGCVTGGGHGRGSTSPVTSDHAGSANGTHAPVPAPLTVAGNPIGIVTDNQLTAPISIPINVCGNSLGP